MSNKLIETNKYSLSILEALRYIPILGNGLQGVQNKLKAVPDSKKTISNKKNRLEF